MTGAEIQEFLCGTAVLFMVTMGVVLGLRWLHGPDYRKDHPPVDGE